MANTASSNATSTTAPTTAPTAQPKLTLLSWNVQWKMNEPKTDQEARHKQILSYIHKRGALPDVCMFQEVSEEMDKAMTGDTRLSIYDYYRYAYAPGHFLLTLVKKSLKFIGFFETCYASHSYTQLKQSNNRETNKPGMLAVAIEINKQIIVIGNTHLIAGGLDCTPEERPLIDRFLFPHLRAEQLRTALTRLIWANNTGTPNRLCVLAGDCNLRPSEDSHSYADRNLPQFGIRSTCTDCNFVDLGKFKGSHKSTLLGIDKESRFDRFFLRGFSSAEAEYNVCETADNHPSDHLPIFAILHW